MDSTDRRMLEHLALKDTVSFGGLVGEMSITGELIADHLHVEGYLMENDLVRVQWPLGNQKFVFITEKGRRTLWSAKKRWMTFFVESWLLIVSTVAALIAAVTGMRQIWISWKSF